MSKFGLIGKDIDYSFSRTYFGNKFKNESLPYTYQNFDIESIALFPKIISENQDLKGLNVTIPFKEKVISYLDFLDDDAKKIGAVNTIKIYENRMTGYNTDHYGFKKSLEEFLPLEHKTALILGTGGASKAVAYALASLGFTYRFVSRNPSSGNFSYSELNQDLIESHCLIINSTPLGTYPDVEQYPDIPYEFLTSKHLLFDLIYNPSKTEFLRRGELENAQIVNGADMLRFQAEKAWEIWNS